MASYFADDASIMQENKDLEKLAKRVSRIFGDSNLFSAWDIKTDS